MTINLESNRRLNTQTLRSSELRLDLAGREELIMRTLGNRSLADYEQFVAQQDSSQEQTAA